jgi:hypothetical protein
VSSVLLMLKDRQWQRMQPHLPGKASDPGGTGADNRLFVEAILWLAGTGVPGAIRRIALAIGTVCSSAFPDDPKTACGIGCLRRWPTIQTSNTS